MYRLRNQIQMDIKKEVETFLGWKMRTEMDMLSSKGDNCIISQ